MEEQLQIVTAQPSLEQTLNNEQSAAKVHPITQAVIHWQSPAADMSEDNSTATKKLLSSKQQTRGKSIKASRVYVNGGFHCSFCASKDVATEGKPLLFQVDQMM